jgi:hypothetical protein
LVTLGPDRSLFGMFPSGIGNVTTPVPQSGAAKGKDMETENLGLDDYRNRAIACLTEAEDHARRSGHTNELALVGVGWALMFSGHANGLELSRIKGAIPSSGGMAQAISEGVNRAMVTMAPR